MKTKILISTIALFLIVTITGCGGSAQMAQNALDRSSDANAQVRDALFVKAWGMNRALVTESREKFLAQAKLGLANGSMTPEAALDFLSEQLKLDEVTVSSNFAYLAMLQVAGERADQAAAVADTYIESTKPIWKHLLGSARDGIEQVRNEYNVWEPLIEKGKEVIDRLINAIKPPPKDTVVL